MKRPGFRARLVCAARPGRRPGLAGAGGQCLGHLVPARPLARQLRNDEISKPLVPPRLGIAPCSTLFLRREHRQARRKPQNQRLPVEVGEGRTPAVGSIGDDRDTCETGHGLILAGRLLPQELQDGRDAAAVLKWRARNAVGQTTFVPPDEARRRLVCPVSLRIEYLDQRSRLVEVGSGPAGISRVPVGQLPAAGDAEFAVGVARWVSTVLTDRNRGAAKVSPEPAMGLGWGDSGRPG